MSEQRGRQVELINGEFRPIEPKSDEALRYQLQDAMASARLVRGFDPVAEAKYLDQASEAAQELFERADKEFPA
jgi:hypothetical protein